MTAYLRDGRKYVCEWADRSILSDWIKRPVFLGLPVEVVNEKDGSHSEYIIVRK